MQPRNTPPAIRVIAAIAVWKRLTTRNVVEDRSATASHGQHLRARQQRLEIPGQCRDVDIGPGEHGEVVHLVLLRPVSSCRCGRWKSTRGRVA